MNLKIGSNFLGNVQIPLLWGSRAVLEDSKGRISIISLGGHEAQVEILGNEPAPGIQYELIADGFKIMLSGKEIYSFNPTSRTITGLSLALPAIEIGQDGIRVAGSKFSGNVVIGGGVGIVVSERGIGIGAPLPKGLAKLVV